MLNRVTSQSMSLLPEIQRCPRGGLCGVMGLALAAWLSACGYSMDSPGLPAQHRTLAVNTIRNATFTAELDVRLQRELRRLLFRDAGIHVVPQSGTDLVLQIEVSEIRVSRRRSVDDTSVGQLTYNLNGLVSLREISSGRFLISRRAIAANSRLDFDEEAETLETPAVRDEGLNDAIELFAARVVDALLVDF